MQGNATGVKPQATHERMSAQVRAMVSQWPWMMTLAWGMGGAALAELAWTDGHYPVLLVLVLVVMACARRAREVFAYGTGYMMATTASVAAGAPRFATEGSEIVMLVVGWALYCAAVGAVWAIGQLGFRRGRTAGWITSVAVQLLLLLPPLWLLGAASPVAGWGYLLGGGGMTALVVGIAASLALGAWLHGRALAERWGMLLVIGLAAFTQSMRDEPDLRNHTGVHGVQTRWPGPAQAGLDGLVGRLDKIASVATAVRTGMPGVNTVVFAESALGDLMGSIGLALDMEVSSVARQHGVQILVGADLRDGSTGRVGMLAIGTDGSVTRHYARQPMPVSLWRPWSASGYRADWQADPTIKLADGRTAIVSYCFEDLVPGMLLAAMQRSEPKPQFVISMANDWWMPSDVGARRQSKMIEGMARLYNVPLVRAVNLPPKAKAP